MRTQNLCVPVSLDRHFKGNNNYTFIMDTTPRGAGIHRAPGERPVSTAAQSPRFSLQLAYVLHKSSRLASGGSENSSPLLVTADFTWAVT